MSDTSGGEEQVEVLFEYSDSRTAVVAQLQGQIQENRKGGSRCTQSVPSRTCTHPPPENFCIFYSLRLLLVHFQVKIQLKI